MQQSAAVRGWTEGDGMRKGGGSLSEQLEQLAADGGKPEGIAFLFYSSFKRKNHRM